MSTISTIMGAEVSRLETDMHAYNSNFSQEHKISAWEGLPPKNADYYNGERFFAVGKDNYRCYRKGWLYGHTYVEPNRLHLDDTDHISIDQEIAEIKKRVALLATQKDEVAL